MGWKKTLMRIKEPLIELLEVRRDINLIFKRKDEVWRQKARCHWLKEEDANTTFFFII